LPALTFVETAKPEIAMALNRRAVDLTYRPPSYFWAADLGLNLSSTIKGAYRRRLHNASLEDGTVLPDAASLPSLSDRERRAWGQIRPDFMGGEYLPNADDREVEIARIVIASTTEDVTCVYAKQVDRRLHYRVVDEYEGQTLRATPTRVSIKPLTLGALVRLFLSAWNLMGCVDMNFADHGWPRGKVHRFIREASSSFYAEFEGAVRARVDRHLHTCHRKLAERS
jgi:hypothetical protein